MTMTDPIADMLTRIRNANPGHATVEIPVKDEEISRDSQRRRLY